MEVRTFSSRGYLRTTTRYLSSRARHSRAPIPLFPFQLFSCIPFCFSSLLYRSFITFYFLLKNNHFECFCENLDIIASTKGFIADFDEVDCTFLTDNRYIKITTLENICRLLTTQYLTIPKAVTTSIFTTTIQSTTEISTNTSTTEVVTSPTTHLLAETSTVNVSSGNVVLASILLAICILFFILGLATFFFCVRYQQKRRAVQKHTRNRRIEKQNMERIFNPLRENSPPIRGKSQSKERKRKLQHPQSILLTNNGNSFIRNSPETYPDYFQPELVFPQPQFLIQPMAQEFSENVEVPEFSNGAERFHMNDLTSPDPRGGTINYVYQNIRNINRPTHSLPTDSTLTRPTVPTVQIDAPDGTDLSDEQERESLEEENRQRRTATLRPHFSSARSQEISFI